MPIIIRAKGDDHAGDVMKKFKKVMTATNIVQVVKDRRYYQKPSEVRTVRLSEVRRMKKRLRSLKKMKNIAQSKPSSRRRAPRHDAE